MTLSQWQAEIGAWHARVFPWARVPHILDKLDEERSEAETAWRCSAPVGELADELADCLICILAAMAREHIDAESALARKWSRVRGKYVAQQPISGRREMTLTQRQTDGLKRLIAFVVQFHGDDLPENAPEVTRDVVALLDGFQETDFAFAEPLLNMLSPPMNENQELPL